MEEIDPMTGLPIMPMQPNRAGVPPRSINDMSKIASIVDPNEVPASQGAMTAKFGSIAMKLVDLSGDDKVTQKDVLIGAGVIDKEGNKI